MSATDSREAKPAALVALCLSAAVRCRASFLCSQDEKAQRCFMIAARYFADKTRPADDVGRIALMTPTADPLGLLIENRSRLVIAPQLVGFPAFAVARVPELKMYAGLVDLVCAGVPLSQAQEKLLCEWLAGAVPAAPRAVAEAFTAFRRPAAPLPEPAV